jgi:hypothetical protein
MRSSLRKSVAGSVTISMKASVPRLRVPLKVEAADGAGRVDEPGPPYTHFT